MMSNGPITFAFVGEARGRHQQWLAEGLRRTLIAHRHQYCSRPPLDIRVVFNLADAQKPRPYRRRTQATFVITIVETDTAHATEIVPLNGRSNGYQEILRVVYPLESRVSPQPNFL